MGGIHTGYELHREIVVDHPWMNIGGKSLKGRCDRIQEVSIAWLKLRIATGDVLLLFVGQRHRWGTSLFF